MALNRYSYISRIKISHNLETIQKHNYINF